MFIVFLVLKHYIKTNGITLAGPPFPLTEFPIFNVIIATVVFCVLSILICVVGLSRLALIEFSKSFSTPKYKRSDLANLEHFYKPVSYSWLMVHTINCLCILPNIFFMHQSIPSMTYVLTVDLLMFTWVAITLYCEKMKRAGKIHLNVPMISSMISFGILCIVVNELSIIYCLGITIILIKSKLIATIRQHTEKLDIAA